MSQAPSRARSILLVAAACSTTALASAAPQGSSETVVTARRVQELVQDVPGSVSVVDEKTLRDSGAMQIKDVAPYVPNLLITEFNSRRLSFPYLRGIGSGQGEPGVATYIDGVPQLTTGSTNLPLVGVERVEFLRGPQGTLYGRNTLGGVMHVITAPPGDQTEISLYGTAGNYGLFEGGFSYSGAITPGKLSVGIEGFYSEREGYTDNLATGNDVDFKETFFGRAQALWTPDERNSVRFSMHGEQSRDGGFALGLVSDLEQKPFEIDQDFEGVTERDLLAPSVTWNHYGDSLDFVSITSFQSWEIFETSDFDFMNFDGVVRTATEEQEYVYQELRVNSAEDSRLALSENAELSWLAGVSFFAADSQRSAANDLRNVVPPPMQGIDKNVGDFDDIGIGVFTQGTVTVASNTDFTAGVRFDTEIKEAELVQTFTAGGMTFPVDQNEFDDEFTQLIPHVSVAHRPAENHSIYATVSKGYKAGGFNLTAPTGSFQYENEESLSYEVGYKLTFLEGAAHLALAAFYIDWEDMQLSLFDPAAGGFVDNVGQSTSSGFELNGDARVHDNVTLFGAFGLTDTEFDEYVDPFGQDVAGNNLPFAPDSTLSVGAQLDGDLGANTRWYLRGEYQMIGDFYYDAGNLGEESFDLANFRLGVERGPVRLDAWVRNAFDQDYIPIAFQPNPADPTVFVGENGAPLTWGVTLRGSF